MENLYWGLLLTVIVYFHNTLQSQGVNNKTVSSTTRKNESSYNCSSNNTSNLTTLRLLTMLPYRDTLLAEYNPSWDQGLSILPALDLAAEQINSRSDILPCHRLELLHVDGGCDIIPKTTLGILRGFFNPRAGKVVGAIGPGCSLSAVSVSMVANRSDIELVVLHDAGSPKLADRVRYKNSLGILGSSEAFANLSFALMKKTKWKNIAVLYESTRLYYRSATEYFVSRSKQELHDVKVKFKAAIFKTFYPLDEVTNSLARIVFLFTSPEHSRNILCLAYHHRLVYPGYQWILASRRLDDFSEGVTFQYHGKNYTCSHETLLNISLAYAFIMNYQLSTEDTSDVLKPLAKITFSEFIRRYQEKIDNHNSDNPNNTLTTTYWAYNMYDAVWAWAHVLDNLTTEHSDLKFTYGNKTLVDMVLDKFYSIHFQGMSGNISFNQNNGFIKRKTNLFQLVGGAEIYITSTNGTDVADFEESYVTIPDIVQRVGLPHKVVVGFFLALQSIEFLAIIMLHVFTVIYWKSKTVKASSPLLSQLVFAGLYLLNIDTFIFSASEIEEYSNKTGGIFCHIMWAWLLPFSFSLIVGTVAAKTWRLYRIFVHYLDPGRFISTQFLILSVLCLLFIDFLIATIWTVFDPMQQKPLPFTVENGSANELMLDRTCSTAFMNGLLWIVLVHVYKLALLLFVVMLSILTRNISNQMFTTSSLQVFSYTFFFVYVIGFATFYLIIVSNNHNPNADYATLSIMLNAMTCLIIACIAFPPLLPIAKEKLRMCFKLDSCNVIVHIVTSKSP